MRVTNATFLPQWLSILKDTNLSTMVINLICVISAIISSNFLTTWDDIRQESMIQELLSKYNMIPKCIQWFRTVGLGIASAFFCLCLVRYFNCFCINDINTGFPNALLQAFWANFRMSTFADVILSYHGGRSIKHGNIETHGKHRGIFII